MLANFQLSRPALLALFFSALVAAAQLPAAGAPPPSSASAAAPVVAAAIIATPPHPGPELDAAIARWKKVDWDAAVKDNQLKFIYLVQQKCQETIVDFTARFFKQERINGDLHDEEAADMKWRGTPFSVYMKYVLGDPGREVLYVADRYDNKLLAHPGGLLGGLIKVKVAPDDPYVFKSNLRPITAAGMTNMISVVVAQCALARANGDLQLQYGGKIEVGGRPAYAIVRFLPNKTIYPNKELVFLVDCEAIVPVGADAYGWDGQLLTKYRFTDFKLNPGLSDLDFDRDNKAYGF
jgi:hypothetical protein